MSMVEAGALSASQVGAGISKALPRPKTSHPYIVGFILLSTGLFALVGSITGTLPSMLAALFVPSALLDSSGNTASPGILSDVYHAALHAADPLSGL
jgi:hypothetical protein